MDTHNFEKEMELVKTIHLSYEQSDNIEVVIKDSLNYLNNFEECSLFFEYLENLNSKLKIKNIHNLVKGIKNVNRIHSSVTLFFIITKFLVGIDYQCNTEKTFYSKKTILKIFENTLKYAFNNNLHTETISLILYKGSKNNTMENITLNNVIDENYLICSGERFYLYNYKNKKYILLGKFFYQYDNTFLTFNKLKLLIYKINNGTINKNYLIDIYSSANPIINKNTKTSDILKIKDLKKFVFSITQKDKFN
tara:strand:+ start:3391 stop:4143 length:753 start_codon:yes stop_codon:yes gene_type:complete